MLFYFKNIFRKYLFALVSDKSERKKAELLPCFTILSSYSMGYFKLTYIKILNLLKQTKKFMYMSTHLQYTLNTYRAVCKVYSLKCNLYYSLHFRNISLKMKGRKGLIWVEGKLSCVLLIRIFLGSLPS